MDLGGVEPLAARYLVRETVDPKSCQDRCVKTTVDTPHLELEEAMRHTGARTKREVVVIALAEFNRRRRLAELVERFGSFESFLTHEELDRMRQAE